MAHLHEIVLRNAVSVTLTARGTADGYAGRQVQSAGASITVRGRVGPARSSILNRSIPYGSVANETRELRVLRSDILDAGWATADIKIGARAVAAGTPGTFTVRAVVDNERTGIFLALIEKDVR